MYDDDQPKIPTIQKLRNIRNQHERFFSNSMMGLFDTFALQKELTQRLFVDATTRLNPAQDWWADLTPDLLNREVLIEHFSDSVSLKSYGNCKAKIGYVLQAFGRILLKDRGREKAPVLVILSYRRPDALLREPGEFVTTDIPGVWVHGSLELGGIILVATTHLPADPRYDWLRRSTRMPETVEEYTMVAALMQTHNLDKLKRDNFTEAIMELMDLIVDGKTPQEWKAAFEAERQLGIDREKRLAAVEEQRRAERHAADLEIQVLRTQLEQLLKNQK